MMKHLQFLLVILFFSTLSINAQTSNLWGMTQGGGSSNHGTIFKTDINGENQTVVYDFPSFSANPKGSLVRASNGKLYGMTFGGGNGGGLIFELDPSSGVFTEKHAFGNGTTWDDGASPNGSLVQTSNGKLYGMTTSGGIGSFVQGVLFEYDPVSEIFTKKHDFNLEDGNHPIGSLIQASNGKLYGMTENGGSNGGGSGVLFEYDPILETYTKKIVFGGIDKGNNPNGDLIQASNGKLYGMTFDGGAENVGVLFEYDFVSETFTKKIDFTGIGNGASPLGNLIQITNGKLYGMTAGGGANDSGILFEYDLASNTLVKKIDFDETDRGSLPFGSLMQALNGKLYGMTLYGGTNGQGILFEYEPASETFIKKLDFDGTNGRNPYYTKLVEVKTLTTETYVPDNNFEQALIDLGYDSGALNDSVPTANINTITSLDVSGKNIVDLTGIEDFTALQNLFCDDNQLTSLDVSQNTSLKTLGCFQNQLTGLDVSQNTLLEDLNCNTNQLTSLDVSQNTALEKLLINNNQITSIDLTHNTALTVLFSLLNPITSLDLSQNAALIDLDCNTSKLTYLNVKNGNNTNFTKFRTTGNPDLTCIEVDDAAWSIANWTLIDATSTFVINQEECTALGTETFEEMKVALYPNPTKGNVTIETGALTDIDISVFSITGEKVYSKYNVTEAKFLIPTGNLPQGLYFIKIHSNKQQQIIKLVKE